MTTENGSLTVKLYYFNPNDYGEQYFVAACSREDAIKSVKRYIREELPKYAESDGDRQYRITNALAALDDYINETRNEWDDRVPCIEEHPIGHVIQTEIS